MSETDAGVAPDLCSVEGCEESKERREYCREHYEDWLASRRVPEAGKRKYEAASFRVPDREIERAYLGGLIDGEGSITHRDTERKYWSVKVYMTDKEIIDWLHANIGGSVNEYLAKNRTKSSHQWHLSRQADVREFLLAVRPYLKVHNKQRKVREALTQIDAQVRAREAKAEARNDAESA